MSTDEKEAAVIKGSANWEKSGPQPGYYKLPGREVFGYSLVDLAMNLVFQAIMMYITFFYTDVFGLRPGHVAVMFLVARLWDTINDPIMGWIVERMNPRHGKYKSWILYGSLPFAVAAILTYSTPDMSYGAKLVWAYATYNLLNMGYTLIIQPYISLASIMTADPSERTRLQSMRMMFAQAGGVIVALTIPLLSDWLNQYFSLQQSYMFTVALMSVLMLAILLYAFTQVTERIRVTSHEDPPGFKEIIRQATNNKYIVLMFLLFFGVYGFNTIVGSSSVYYISYYADRPDMMAWFSLMVVLPSVFGVPIVPWLIGIFRKKGTVILGLITGAAGAIALAFLPPEAITLMLVFRGVSSFGYGILMGSLWAIIIDPVEYGDLNTGRRLTAIVMTLIGLGLKTSMLLGGVIPAWILEAVDYVPDVAQSEEALNGIHFMSTWLPAIILLVTLVIFGLFYDLNEEKVADIQHKIAVRDGLVEPVTEEEHALVNEANAQKTARDAERGIVGEEIPPLGTTSAAPATIDPTITEDPKED